MGDLEPPICVNCKQLSTKDLSCTAYPAGIPDEIIRSAVDHRKPYKGDHGIQYDPIDPEWIVPADLGDGGDVDPSVVI